MRVHIQNIGTMVTGHAGAGLLSILALAVTARAVGLEAFGLLVMIQTFVRVVDALVNFQTWQALVKFAAEAQAEGVPGRYGGVVRACAWLDRLTAATAVLLAAGLTLGAWGLGYLGATTLVFTLLYAVTIATNLTGAPMGVLRLAGRFRLLAVTASLGMAFKLALVLVGWAAGFSFTYFLCGWIVSEMVQHVVLIAAGERELRRQGEGSLFGRRSGPLRAAHPGLLHFAVMTNLTVSIKLAGRQLAVLMTGGLLGEAAAGLLKVGQTVNRLMGLVADPIDQVMYPEFSRLWSTGQYRAMYRTVAVMGGLAFLAGAVVVGGFAWQGEWVLELGFGAAYVPAYSVTLWLMCGTSILLLGIGLHGALLAQGKAGTLMWVHLVGYALCVPALPWLLWTYGLLGAGVYAVAFQLYRLVSIGGYLVWHSPMRRRVSASG